MIRRFGLMIGAAVVVVGPVAAQHDKHEGMKMDQGMMKMMMETPWREMNGFHSLLHLSHQAMMKSGDLATDTRAFAGLVEANGTDQDVKAALGNGHDQFEAAPMACMPMGTGNGMKGMEHRKPPQ